jgi:acyl carrier protein
MNAEKLEAVLAKELRRIAPDVEITEIDKDGDLREEFDIDSMDFLNLVTALSKQFSIEMPEADYPRMATFNAMVTYLREHTND